MNGLRIISGPWLFLDFRYRIYFYMTEWTVKGFDGELWP